MKKYSLWGNIFLITLLFSGYSGITAGVLS